MSPKVPVAPSPLEQDNLRRSWALITVASLGKQIGMLQEQLLGDGPKLKELQAIEVDFEELLFSGETGTAHSLLALAKRIDSLRQS